MKQSDTTPWYKQFWPWFLITIPVISMILSITMLNLALNTEDSLVIDDYYKEGRGINLELTKVQEAKVQGISTRITFNNKRVSLEFNTGAPQSAQERAEAAQEQFAAYMSFMDTVFTRTPRNL